MNYQMSDPAADLRNEIGGHEEASYLYCSSGWLFEPEESVMLSLQKSRRGSALAVVVAAALLVSAAARRQR